MRAVAGLEKDTMSSEQFEHYEYEFDNITKSITRKINTQLPNYTGGTARDAFTPSLTLFPFPAHSPPFNTSSVPSKIVG
jgi:hypothetical protein